MHSWLLIPATLSASVKKQFGPEVGAILIMDGARSHYPTASVEADGCQVGSSGWLLWRERRHRLRTLCTDTAVGAVFSSSKGMLFSPPTQMSEDFSSATEYVLKSVRSNYTSDQEKILVLWRRKLSQSIYRHLTRRINEGWHVLLWQTNIDQCRRL